MMSAKKIGLFVLLIVLVSIVSFIVIAGGEPTWGFAVNEENFEEVSACENPGSWLVDDDELKRYVGVQGYCNLDGTADNCDARIVLRQAEEGSPYYLRNPTSGYISDQAYCNNHAMFTNTIPWVSIIACVMKGDSEKINIKVKFDDILGHNDTFSVEEKDDKIEIQVLHSIKAGVASGCNYEVGMNAHNDDKNIYTSSCDQLWQGDCDDGYNDLCDGAMLGDIHRSSNAVKNGEASYWQWKFCVDDH